MNTHNKGSKWYRCKGLHMFGKIHDQCKSIDSEIISGTCPQKHLGVCLPQSAPSRPSSPSKHFYQGLEPSPWAWGCVSRIGPVLTRYWACDFCPHLCLCFLASLAVAWLWLGIWYSLSSPDLWENKLFLYSHSKLYPLFILFLGESIAMGSGNEPGRTLDTQDS